MQSERLPKWLQSSAGRYGFAIAAIGVIVAAKLLLRTYLGDETIYPLFYAGVLVSAWFGGFRAGLLATVLVLLATHFVFIDYVNDRMLTNVLRLIVFGFEGVLISFVIEALHAANRQAHASAQDLQTERYRLLETAHEGICTLDAEHRIEYVNRRLCDMLGYESQQLLGKPLAEFILDDKQDTARKAFSASSVGMDQSWDISLKRCTGGDLITHLSTSSISRGGKVLGCLAMFTDVTERTRAERALRRSDEQSRLLTEALPQIIWTCTPSGHPEYFNQKWFQYSGLGEEKSFSSLGWLQLLHPSDLDACNESWESCLKSGKTYEVECRFRDATGVYRWHVVRAIPLLSTCGEVLRWIGSCTDIEEHKRAAEQVGSG